MILQTENLPPDGDGVFPRPNDDEDGGTITMAFSSPAQLQRLRLVDIDAGDGTSRRSSARTTRRRGDARA